MATLMSVLAFVVLGYLLSRALKRNDVADTLWGLGFVLVALANARQVGELTFRAKLIVALTLAWGLRLAFYIARRSLSKKEDPRYANWRKDWGSSEPVRSFFQIFVLQGGSLESLRCRFRLPFAHPTKPSSVWILQESACF